MKTIICKNIKEIVEWDNDVVPSDELTIGKEYEVQNEYGPFYVVTENDLGFVERYLKQRFDLKPNIS